MRLLLLLAFAGCIGHTTAAITVTARVAPAAIAVDFYGVQLTADVMFVVDRSTSMSGELADTKRALLSAIDRMPDGARVGIVFFDDTVTVLDDLRDPDGRAEDPKHPRSRPQSDSDRVVLSSVTRQRLHRFVSSIEVRREIEAFPVMKAFGWSFGDSAAHHLVLVSGGLAPSSYDRRALLEQVTHLRRSGVRIDTVAVRRNQDLSLLQQLAMEAGGVAVIRD